MTTRVDFYVLSANAPQALTLTACRITEKAWLQDNRVYLHTDSRQTAERVNDALWTFRDGSFVPHELFSAQLDDAVPIVIGHGECPAELRGVLVNLDAQVPSFFTQFERVVELIAATDEARQMGRQRWREYKERGCEIQSHNV